MFRFSSRIATCLLTAIGLCRAALAVEPPAIDFDRDIRPIFAAKCTTCHGKHEPQGGLSLLDRASLTRPLDSGSIGIVPGHPEASELMRRITSADSDERMPQKLPPLKPAEVAAIRRWIAQGADWPAHWAIRPLAQSTPPDLTQTPLAAWPQNDVDRFIGRALLERGLAPSPAADSRTLLRRLHVDLTGLLPTPAETEAFLVDQEPGAYERLVDRLLASPRYGERWARHWMDVVHYADSHGQEHDRPRDNAWPYRDYLIAALNADTAYGKFLDEQIAGDVLFPDNPALIAATGFLAAGPWDESSHRDIADPVDKANAQNLDRDDVVTTTMSTLVSSTVQCARCHDHKFDPISQAQYYSLQAVFAGIDRADRSYDSDPAVAVLRQQYTDLRSRLPAMVSQNDPALDEPQLAAEVAAWEVPLTAARSQWADLPIAEATSTGGATLAKLDDGSWLSSGTRPEKDVYQLVATAPTDKPITGIRLEVFPHESLPVGGPGRHENGNFQLTELHAYFCDAGDRTVKTRITLRSARSDFDQVSYPIAKAIDDNQSTGWSVDPQFNQAHQATFELTTPCEVGPGKLLLIELHQQYGRGHLIGRFRVAATSAAPASNLVFEPISGKTLQCLATPPQARTPEQRRELAAIYLEKKMTRLLSELPPRRSVYCGTNHFSATGYFKPAITPRPVHVLRRGEISQPLDEARPGALSMVTGPAAQFELSDANDEGQRRAALAHWISDPRNMLTWRSIVNRIWYYHFGQGIVETLNDFGQMGAAPSHPELLDYLALTLQQQGGSLKALHRLIVTSAAYRQSSADRSEAAAMDQSNVWLWRMNCRRLDAETLRDSLLLLGGKLDLQMGGPPVKQYVELGSNNVTPILDYFAFPPDNPANYRRSVYRFQIRTVPDPLMDALGCPDGSRVVPKRLEATTALQVLATLHDHFVIHQSRHLAAQIDAQTQDPGQRIVALYRLLLSRDPTPDETADVAEYVARHGLANACRFLVNSNTFMFLD